MTGSQVDELFARVTARDAQLDALEELEVEGGRCYIRQAEALLELWDTASADSRVGTTSHVTAEAAGALHLSPLSIDRRLATAMTLREHPLLPALMRDGKLGVPHALAAIDEIDALGHDPADPPDLADQALHAVLACGGRLGWDGTPAELRRALRRAIVRLDPAGTQRRREEQTATRTGIRLRALSDGLAALTATGPATQLTATDRLLDVLSRPAGPDDPRSRGQRQIDALLAALVARAGTAVDLELQIAIPVQVTDTTPVTGCDPEPLAIQADLSPDLLALLAQEQAPSSRPQPAEPAPAEAEPAEPTLNKPGLNHPEPAEVEAELAELAEAESALTEPALTEPALTGPAIDVDELAEMDQIEQELRRLAQQQTSPQSIDRKEAASTPADREPPEAETAGSEPGPTTDAPPPASHEPARRLGRRQGVPELLDHGAVDPALLGELLTNPHGLPVGIRRLQLRRICLDPQGQAVAIDNRPLPLAALLASHPDPAQLLQQLTSRLPAPPPATGSYQPTAAQTRLLHARDTTCTFPGCARRARRCELDHRNPHADGGPTSTVNLHPLCKHHHRLKHDGWTCTRSPDGTTHWASPRGQHLRTRPG